MTPRNDRVGATSALHQLWSTTMPGAMPAGQQDIAKIMHLAAHNQLGIIEYCKDQGSVGDDVVALQKRIVRGAVMAVRVTRPEAAPHPPRRTLPRPATPPSARHPCP